MRKVQAADENLELYVLNKALIENIESLFLTKASYCTLFSQQGQGQNEHPIRTPVHLGSRCNNH